MPNQTYSLTWLHTFCNRNHCSNLEILKSIILL